MESVFTIVQNGETIDALAQKLAKHNPEAYGSKEAAESIIMANNPTAKNGIWPGTGLNITPRVYGYQMPDAWDADEPTVHHEFRKMNRNTRQLLTQDPDAARAMLEGMEEAKKSNWAVGWDDIMTMTSYGVTGLDAYYGTQSTYYGTVQESAAQLVKEAVAELGEKTVFKKNPANLQKLESFLRRSLTFKRMQAAIQNLPKHLAKKIGKTSPQVNINCANARWARKEIFIPAMNRSSRYFSRMNTLVGKNLVRLGRIGTTTTWIIPSCIGVYNTMKAEPTDRGLVGTKEAFGVVFGAAGTTLGLTTGYLLAASLTLSTGGAFLLVAVVAGLMGWALSELGKYLGEQLYGAGNYISLNYF